MLKTIRFQQVISNNWQKLPKIVYYIGYLVFFNLHTEDHRMSSRQQQQQIDLLFGGIGTGGRNFDRANTDL